MGEAHGIHLQESDIKNFGKVFETKNGQLRMYCGDLFKFSPEMLPNDVEIGAIMDKGSAVALPPELRPSYFEQMKLFCSSNKCKLVGSKFMSISVHWLSK